MTPSSITHPQATASGPTDRPRPPLRHRLMPHLPALALTVAGLLALSGQVLSRPGIPGQFVVLTPPRLAPGAVIDLVHRAGGGTVGFGRLPGISLALSDRPDFAARARALGAWVVLPASADLGCVAADPEGAR